MEVVGQRHSQYSKIGVRICLLKVERQIIYELRSNWNVIDMKGLGISNSSWAMSEKFNTFVEIPARNSGCYLWLAQLCIIPRTRRKDYIRN